jgi:hypothetical protein
MKVLSARESGAMYLVRGGVVRDSRCSVKCGTGMLYSKNGRHHEFAGEPRMKLAGHSERRSARGRVQRIAHRQPASAVPG